MRWMSLELVDVASDATFHLTDSKNKELACRVKLIEIMY
jgi:hypothetical protein